jgi:hypothetical protein
MDKLSGRDRWRAALVVLFLLGGCAGTGPTPGTERDIPAGRTLVRNGVAAPGTVVAISDAPATCRAPEAWKPGGSGVRVDASGPPWAGSACPLVTAQLAPDGSTLAIYDFSDGRAELFDLAEGGFVPAGTATISMPAVFGFPPPGRNVALAAGGQKLLLGSINHGCRISDAIRVCGSAELFERHRHEGGWLSVATLLPPADEDGLTRFGQSVALSSDGSLALVGGTGEPGLSGALWVYALGQRAPKLLQRLSAEAAENGFANDLALSSDGTWLAVGGEQAVYLFERTGDGFSPRKTIRPPDADAGYFGETVALSGDGRHLLVGAPRTNCAQGDRCGVAYLFERDQGWGLGRTVRPATNAGDANFGHHIAISQDGRELAAQGALIHVFTQGVGP